MINYNKLYYFYVIARTGSMSNAAEQLYISQPALSKAVKELEQTFDVPLFDRKSRILQLTPAGEALKQECQRIYDNEESILLRMKEFSSGQNRTLRFGYMIFNEVEYLKDIQTGFQKKYPQITLNSRSYIERTDITNDLLNNRLDIGLKLFTMDDVIPELDFHTLQESHLAIIVEKHHPLANRKELNLSELANEDFIFLGSSTASSEYNTTTEWCHRCGFEPKIQECYDHVGMVLMMVKSRFGITILSDLAPLDYMSDLVMIPLVNAPTFYSGLFWRKNKPSPEVMQFVDYYLNRKE